MVGWELGSEGHWGSQSGQRGPPLGSVRRPVLFSAKALRNWNRAESCPGDFLPGEQWGSSPAGSLASGTSLKLWELNEEIHVQHLTASCVWNVLNKRELSSSGGSAKVGKVKLSVFGILLKIRCHELVDDQMNVCGQLMCFVWPKRLKKKSTFVVNKEKWGDFADKSWLSKNFQSFSKKISRSDNTCLELSTCDLRVCPLLLPWPERFSWPLLGLFCH